MDISSLIAHFQSTFILSANTLEEVALGILDFQKRASSLSQMSEFQSQIMVLLLPVAGAAGLAAGIYTYVFKQKHHSSFSSTSTSGLLISAAANFNQKNKGKKKREI